MVPQHAEQFLAKRTRESRQVVRVSGDNRNANGRRSRNPADWRISRVRTSAKFLSSGFTAVSSTKTVTPPASDSIRNVEPGDVSGQMRITLMKYPGGISYEVRWAPAVSAGNPGTWASQPVGLLRPATTISGLTPGTTYVFQVRAVTRTGYSDWSDSVTRMAV